MNSASTDLVPGATTDLPASTSHDSSSALDGDGPGSPDLPRAALDAQFPADIPDAAMDSASTDLVLGTTTDLPTSTSYDSSSALDGPASPDLPIVEPDALFPVEAGVPDGGSSFTPTYTPAAKGTSVGSPVTATIDSAGGKVVSSDGRLDVTFPAGMLTAATDVSIQSITNTVPNGLGGAYRLAPEGTTFSQPVTLTFHLSDMENSGIDSTFIATQHDDNFWYSQPHQIRDATAQTVSVNATHFSDWALVGTIVLTPLKTRVRTGTTASFTGTVVLVDPNENVLADPEPDELEIPSGSTLDKMNSPRTWAVNFIPGGNTQIGQISDPGAYTAPGTVPSPSNVTVMVTAQIDKSKAFASAEADLYAQELWSGSTDVTQLDGTKIHAEVTFVQKIESGSATMLHFTVQSGTVHLTPPPMSTAGCPETLDPVIHDIGPNDGSLSVTYDLATGPEDANVVGAGTTAWAGTYTEMCANGTQTVQSTIVAQWWPINLLNPMGGLTAQNGVLDGPIGNQSASGLVHLARQ
jgi:hypothetical protein